MSKTIIFLIAFLTISAHAATAIEVGEPNIYFGPYASDVKVLQSNFFPSRDSNGDPMPAIPMPDLPTV